MTPSFAGKQFLYLNNQIKKKVEVTRLNQEELTAHVLLAKNGNTESFCKLYELYYKEMYRFAYYMLGNESDAEDVISETVIDAFTGIKNLKHPEKFKAWIFRILTTKCKRQIALYVKKREYQSDTEANQEGNCTDSSYAQDMDVQNAFHALNDTEKTVISLMVFAGYNSREIAKLLNSREGTIRSLKSRALQKMSKYLKEDYA